MAASIPVNTLLTTALSEIGVSQAGDTVSGDDLDLALFIFNEIVDAWNADEKRIFSTAFQSYTLVPSLSPHTIGVAADTPTFTIPTGLGGGTSVLGVRPDRIMGCNILLQTAPPGVASGVNIRDQAWWLNQRNQLLTSGLPTDLYYSNDWPNGSIYFWPVPTIAYGVQLEIPSSYGKFVNTDNLQVPQGYRQALRLSLAEALVGPFTVPMPQGLPQRAMEARQLVFSQNEPILRIQTADSGLNRSSGQRSNWNYLSGRTQ